MAFLSDIVDDDSYKATSGWTLRELEDEELENEEQIPCSWKLGDMVFLFSGTGSGKTTLALQKVASSYLENHKTVLYLVPRVILQRQIENDMQKIRSTYNSDLAERCNKNFFVYTYQYLENLIFNEKFTQSFDLIICDEFHYFITDAIFNNKTQISYDFIFHNKNNNNSLKLFLSATSNEIMEYIKLNNIFERPFEYYQEEDEEPKNDAYTEIIELLREYIGDINSEPLKIQISDTVENSDTVEKKENDNCKKKKKKKNKDYWDNDYWDDVDDDDLIEEADRHKAYIYALPKEYNYVNIKYVISDDEIIEIIKNSKEKTIIFVSNKEKGKKLDEEINKSLTENTKNTEKKTIFITADNKNTNSKEDIENICYTNTFSKKVLITTSVLDVGVNFLDAEIKNIVIAASEPVEFLQMLGRLRVIQEGQEVSLYIYKRDARYFRNLRDNLIKPDLDCCEFIEKYPKKLNDILKMEIMSQYDLPNDYTLNKLKKFLYIDCWHDNNLSLNKLAIYRLRRLYALYNEIYEKIQQDEDYFIKKQLEWLGLENTFSIENFLAPDIKKIRIKRLQEAIENEIAKNININNGLTNDKCRNLLDRFKLSVKSIDKEWVRSNTSLSVKRFNIFCKTYDIPYCIGKRQNQNNMYYYLVKLDDKIIDELKLEIDL